MSLECHVRSVHPVRAVPRDLPHVELEVVRAGQDVLVIGARETTALHRAAAMEQSRYFHRKDFNSYYLL